MTGPLLLARAKVNLYLHVVGKRTDGYHLLDSLAVFPDIGDRLRVQPANDLTLTIDGPMAGALAAETDNIVMKAARALAQAAGIPPRAALHLTKVLPIASGIGGGSADGAAALRGLCALWGVTLPEAQLAKIALAIGADLPVCLRSRPTKMAGIGEILSDPPALPPAWMLLVNPTVALSTPAVFKARAPGFSPPAPLTTPPRDAADLALALHSRTNDLSAPAIALAPVIAEVLAAIGHQPDCLLARMSGSGATCFGLFPTVAAVERAVKALAASQPQWWIASGKI